MRLHDVRFDEIMFLQSSGQTCIRIAELKTCGMRRKKGMAVWYFFAIGVVCWANLLDVFCWFLLFFLERFGSHGFATLFLGGWESTGRAAKRHGCETSRLHSATHQLRLVGSLSTMIYEFFYLQTVVGDFWSINRITSACSHVSDMWDTLRYDMTSTHDSGATFAKPAFRSTA